MPIKSPSPFFIVEMTGIILFVVAFAMTRAFMEGNYYEGFLHWTLGIIVSLLNVKLVSIFDLEM